MPKPVAIYGGPYAHEVESIKEESERKKPNYEKLISGWKSISQGALDYIEDLKNPANALDGNFSENSVIDYENFDTYIPKVYDFDRDKGKGPVLNTGAPAFLPIFSETPVKETVEVDLEKL